MTSDKALPIRLDRESKTPRTRAAQVSTLGKPWNAAFSKMMKVSEQIESEHELMVRVITAIRDGTPYPGGEAQTCLNEIEAMRSAFEEENP
jgi:hypothetical protein